MSNTSNRATLKNGKTSEQRTLPSGIVCEAMVMMGGDHVHLSAWEAGLLFGDHSTVTTFDGNWYGKIGTERISPEIEALKGGSPERIAACDRHRAYHCERARIAIAEAFPEFASIMRIDFGGSFELYLHEAEQIETDREIEFKRQQAAD